MLGPRGIRANAIAPAVVATEMSNFAKTEEGRDYALGIQALKRLAQPDDIGGVVAFLASEDARWITGDTLDGGIRTLATEEISDRASAGQLGCLLCQSAVLDNKACDLLDAFATL